MKDRQIACKHYVNEGNCDIGREGTFKRQCQHCKAYDPIPGGLPASKRLKKTKLEKIRKDKRNWE